MAAPALGRMECARLGAHSPASIAPCVSDPRALYAAVLSMDSLRQICADTFETARRSGQRVAQSLLQTKTRKVVDTKSVIYVFAVHLFLQGCILLRAETQVLRLLH